MCRRMGERRKALARQEGGTAERVHGPPVPHRDAVRSSPHSNCSVAPLCMPLVPHSLDCSQTGSRGDNSETSMGLHSEEGCPWGVSARYECAARFGRAAPCRILRCASDVCRLASPCQLRPDSKILASTCADSIRTQQRRSRWEKSRSVLCDDRDHRSHL